MLSKLFAASSFINIFLKKLISSKKFFLCIIAFIILQGLWYAFMIKIGLYDEGRHVGFILKYTEQNSPFISEQKPDWDFLGEVTRDGSYLFYYGMSIVAKIGFIFTENVDSVIKFMRMVMIMVFVVGVILYRKCLLEAGSSKWMAHLSLLLLALLPMIAPMPGVVNYDNAVFTLFAILLLITIRILKSSRFELNYLLVFLGIGMFGSVVKYQFLALFIPLAFLILYTYVKKNYLHDVFYSVTTQYKNTKPVTKTLVLIFILTSFGLFVERPVYNILNYGSPTPSCLEFMSRERCSEYFVVERDLSLAEQKSPDFNPLSPFDYVLSLWLPSIITTLLIIIGSIDTLLVVQLFFYTAIMVGIIAIFVNLKRILRNNILRMFFLVSIFYISAIILVNYMAYIKLAAPVATNGRYLLPVLPILIYLAIYSLSKTLNNLNLRSVIFSTFILLLPLLLIQGGGIVTAIVALDEGAYWNDGILIEEKAFLREGLQVVVFERNPFRKF